MGASGASGMLSMGKKMQSWGQNKIKAGAGAATFGAGGRLARATIGRGAEAWANTDKMKDRAARGGAGSKLALKTLRNIGDSNFDARNTGMAKKMGLGEGVKNGYKTKKEAVKKERLDYAKSLKGDSETQATDAAGNLQFEMEADGVTRRKNENGEEIEVKKSRTEVYGESMGKRGIWSTVSGNTATNRKAAKVIEAEYEKKRKLENAQRALKTDAALNETRTKLKEAKDHLKIAEADKLPLTDFLKDVHKEEKDLKGREDELKELVEKAKKAYEKAKEDSKT